MAQRKAIKARWQADSKGLHYHFNFKNGVFLKIKIGILRDDRKGYQRNGGRGIKDSSQRRGKGKAFKSLKRF